MSRNNLFIFSVAIILAGMFLSACAPEKNNDLLKIGGFVGGNKGVVMKLLEGAPPSIVQAAGATPFSIDISLENQGEAKVGPGTDNPLVQTRLTGIVLKDFGLTEQSSVKTLAAALEPAKRNFDGTIFPGEIGEIVYDNLSYLPAVFDTYALTIRTELCYDYESYATAKFCMKKDLVESAQDASICMLRGPRPFGASGAPIQVTKVEEAPINQNTIQVNFMIEHVGNGLFFYRGTADPSLDCEFSDLNPDIYKIEVFVEPVQQNTYSVKCNRLDDQLATGGVHGVMRMPGGAPLSISCFVARTTPFTTRVYEDLLNVKLRYRYGEFIEQPILVQGHI